MKRIAYMCAVLYLALGSVRMVYATEEGALVPDVADETKSVEKPEDIEAAQEEKIKDIVIGDYEKEMYVGKSQTLEVTMVPSTSYETIAYTSSDTNILKVSAQGEVKAVARGTARINVSAGDITREIEITVLTPTTDIKLGSNYIVLKVGEEYKLTADVQPYDADWGIGFRSSDDEVIGVGYDGLITAKKPGHATVIVSNKDYVTSAMVIVNSGDEKSSEEGTGDSNQTVVENKIPEGLKLLDKDTLRKLYDSGETYSVKCDGYEFIVDGKNIVNHHNELSTDIELKSGKETTFTVNGGKPICGDVVIHFDKRPGKYLYLYNEAKGKYEYIDAGRSSEIKITIPGRYMFTDKKIVTGREAVVLILAGSLIVIVIGVIVYVVVNKRYLFW
ncbi:MAG: Ig-like domain-containing protein [Lachnospiraceae bacterium]|nr:Ig-like domain-containing protein [Lachnospiraceae bacterium]